MKVLILGGSGHIGKRLAEMLTAGNEHETISASRHPGTNSSPRHQHIALDARNETALVETLVGVNCVVNCIAGDASSIADGAKVLVQAALKAQCRRIVHLSTMSVYGHAEGLVTESTALDPNLSWYAKAKCEAEGQIERFVAQGGSAAILRPGCVYGPGSELWVGRIGRLLMAGRLGDIGALGDGWSNLVHVNDVCRAVMALMTKESEAKEPSRFNLATPDSPRWNEYFIDLALAINAVPVVRVGKGKVLLNSYVHAPLFKTIEKILGRLPIHDVALPDIIPPNLLRFFGQQIKLDVTRATSDLKLQLTPYRQGLGDSVAWFDRHALSS